MTLKEMRQNAGYTQSLAATKLFVSANAVSQWERGQNRMSSKYIPKLAKLYHVTDDEIIDALRLAMDGEKS